MILGHCKIFHIEYDGSPYKKVFSGWALLGKIERESMCIVGLDFLNVFGLKEKERSSFFFWIKRTGNPKIIQNQLF